MPDGNVRYAEEIADPKVIVLVAEWNGEVIGFAIADPAKGELSAIYVKPNPIGRVGGALLSELEKRASPTAEALTCVAALSALQFYQDHGYTEQGDVDYVDGSGASIPCILVTKILSGNVL